MFKRLFYLVFLFVCGLKNIYSQSSTVEMPKITPPSPNVSAMQRYGDIPVGLYSGVPNISVPLYEIKSDDITVPISISYHASGVKVADEASRIGLGWVLNAGGVISRNIVGKDDFSYNGGFYYHNTSTPDIVNGPPYLGNILNIQDGCALILDRI